MESARVVSHHTIHHTQGWTFAAGILSVTPTFRLMVTGNTELKHLDKLRNAPTEEGYKPT